jgi:hypothetical protein
LSSDRMDRHTLPLGKTFGWYSGGSNLPAGKGAIHEREGQRVGRCVSKG